MAEKKLNARTWVCESGGLPVANFALCGLLTFLDNPFP